MENGEIVNTIKKAIRQLIGEKETYSKADFNIIYIGTVGLDPSVEERKLIFKDKEEINLYNMLNFFTEKLSATWDPELKALELFRILDKNGKYFIDKEDIIQAWGDIDSKLPLDTLLDCFNTVASENTLDYFNFKNIYLKVLAKHQNSQ